jgi:pimeloyl-ACP methyl ester carboxylesterase
MTARTDTYGDVSVMHHGVTAGDGAPLSVTRVLPVEDAHATPVIMLHGTYSNRHFWLSPKGKGLARFFRDGGYDVWIPEFRGHGLSPKGEAFRAYDVEQQIRHDIPAFAEYITVQTDCRDPVWIGHSLGGLALYASLAAGWLPPERVRALATAGSQASEGDAYLRYPLVPGAIRLALRMLGIFPARKLGMGPEDEPVGVIHEFLRWKGRGGSWSSKDGFLYWDGFDKIRMPCLVVTSEGDKTDPAAGCRYLFEKLPAEDKTYILLGVAHGSAKDYDHVGMLIDPAAHAEVWPRILQWVDERRVGKLASSR